MIKANIMPILILTGPIPESKGMCAIFSENGQEKG